MASMAVKRVNILLDFNVPKLILCLCIMRERERGGGGGEYVGLILEWLVGFF